MIRFQLVGVTGTKFDEEVYEVVMPTEDGTIGVFGQHMPLMSAAAPGLISVRRQAGDASDKMEVFSTAGGVIQVDGQTVRFLADEVAAPDEISEADALKALENAQKLATEAKTHIDLAEAQRLVKGYDARLQAVRRRKRR